MKCSEKKAKPYIELCHCRHDGDAPAVIANVVPPLDITAWAKSEVSGSDAVSGSDKALPPVNRINFFRNPMAPKASGMLTHVTSNGSSISVSALFTELNLEENPDKVTGISCNTHDTSSETESKDEKNEKPPFTGEPLSAAFGGLILSGVLFAASLIMWKKRMNAEVRPDE